MHYTSEEKFTKTEEPMTLVTKEEGSVLNADDLKLAEMGYKPVYP
jgi:hypothetical protein